MAYCSHASAAARRTRRSVTLVELMVSLSIVAMSFSLFFPAIQAARASSRRSRCSNQMRQLGIAVNQFAATNGQRLSGLPWVRSIKDYLEVTKDSAVGVDNLAQCPATPGFPNYVETTRISPDLPTTIEARDYVMPARLKISYAPPRRQETLIGIGSSRSLRKVTDGLSKTYLLLEQAGPKAGYVGRPAHHAEGQRSSRILVDADLEHRSVWSASGGTFKHHSIPEADWYSGMEINRTNKAGIYSFHDGANAAMCDGSVRFQSEDTDPKVNIAFFTINAGDLSIGR